MRKELFKNVKIPENVEVTINGNLVEVTGQEGKLEKNFDILNLVFEKKDKEIIIGNKNSTKRDKRMANTIIAHLKNMIKGVQKKFEYKLKICFSHFPFTVEIKGRDVTIKNFLGEKFPRTVELPKGVEAEVDKEIITIRSVDKELAGQAAAKFEGATKISKRDRRIFQDGIYMINKAGKEI